MNQKGFLNTLVIILALVVIAGIAGYFVFFQKEESLIPTGKSETANWKTYQSNNYGFEFHYPIDWVIDDRYNSFGFNGGVAVRSPNSNIEVYPYAISILIKNGSYNNSRHAFEAEIFPTLRKDIDHEVKDIKFNGTSAISFTDLGIMDTKNIILTNGTRLIEISYTSEAQNTNNINQILSTFKFINQNSNSSNNLIVRNDWGISFAKPSNWNVTNNAATQIELKPVSGEWKDDVMTVQYVSGEKITDQSAKFGDITYWYDQSKGKWMRTGRTNELTGVTESAVVEATPEFYVAGNMPVFIGMGRWLTYIVPLSHTSFLKFKITGSGYTQPLTDLIKTISKP